MSDPKYDLCAVLGANLSRTFTLTENGTPLPLTGWTPSLVVMRDRGGDVLHTINDTNGFSVPGDGVIELQHFCGGAGWPPALTAGKYHYRMRLVASATNVWSLWVGRFEVVGQ